MIEVGELLVGTDDLPTYEDLVLILDVLQTSSEAVLEAERESPSPEAWRTYQHSILRAQQRVATLLLVHSLIEVQNGRDPAPGHSGWPL